MYDEFPWYSRGVTGFVDVRDVVAAMVQLMESDISAERFIISAENRSYEELFNFIANAFGKKRHAKNNQVVGGYCLALGSHKSWFTGNDPLVTKETAATALASVNFDNRKLKTYLPGFAYRKIEDTVNDTCAVFQQKLNSL